MNTVPDDFKAAKAEHDRLDNEMKEASKRLKNYPTGKMGLTPDHVKNTTNWKRDKENFDRAFRTLRSYNGVYVKKFKRELKAERDERLRSLNK